jgi:hypothetical protein
MTEPSSLLSDFLQAKALRDLSGNFKFVPLLLYSSVGIACKIANQYYLLKQY